MALRDVIIGTMGELGCQVLDLQLRLYKEAREDSERRDARTWDLPLFEAAAAKVAGSLGDDPNADLQAINALPIPVLTRAFGETWERLSHPALCSAKAKAASQKSNSTDPNVFSIDIDEW
jgi:hypothetical protein